MLCGRQASETFRPLFSISPMMRMICSALCRFFMVLVCRLPCKTLVEKCPHFGGWTRTANHPPPRCDIGSENLLDRGGSIQASYDVLVEKSRYGEKQQDTVSVELSSHANASGIFSQAASTLGISAVTDENELTRTQAHKFLFRLTPMGNGSN
jgi:hypothetical protein